MFIDEKISHLYLALDKILDSKLEYLESLRNHPDSYIMIRSFDNTVDESFSAYSALYLAAFLLDPGVDLSCFDVRINQFSNSAHQLREVFYNG